VMILSGVTTLQAPTVYPRLGGGHSLIGQQTTGQGQPNIKLSKAGTKEFTGTENYHGNFRCGCSAGRHESDPLKIRT
jgi:hypothetical protein